MFPKDMADWEDSYQQYEEIRELKTNTTALKGLLNETEKSLSHGSGIAGNCKCFTASRGI